MACNISTNPDPPCVHCGQDMKDLKDLIYLSNRVVRLEIAKFPLTVENENLKRKIEELEEKLQELLKELEEKLQELLKERVE